MELTKQQFVEKINSLNANKATFNVESADTGSVYVSLYGCNISVTLEDGICGEISMYKPNTEMDISIDFDLVDWIEEDEEEKTIRLELNNGLSDIVIGAVE